MFEITLLAGAIAALILTAAAAGEFLDRDGGKHAWTIDEAHALIWEGEPYVPFGIVIRPRYLAGAQTDENLTADAGDIEALTLAGVKDVIIRPGKALSSLPVEAFQKVVDLLESAGLRYGIELDDSPYEALSGYVIDPVTYRASGIMSPGEITYVLADSKLAIYALCDVRTSGVTAIGQEIAAAGSVTVRANIEPGVEHLLLLYPQKVIAPGSQDWSLPDLWSGGDRHRDRLAAFLSKIKFGKGLRFLADPFGAQLGLRGEAEYLVPASPEFRIGYAAWLSRKYRSLNGLKTAWAVRQYEIASFDEASRMIPLWSEGRGLAAVYSEKTGKKHDVDVPNSGIWSDLRDYRSESVRQFMDGISDVLKRTVADVPVVFTANGFQPFFLGSGSVGFDGLSVLAPAIQGAESQAGSAFSLAEHSSRRVWIISRIGSSGVPLGKKDELFGYINPLSGLGAKGFYVEEGAIPSGASGADALVWLAEYAASASSDKQFAARRPPAIYYPEKVAGTGVRRLSGGVWWLPSFLPGRGVVPGGGICGYSITMPDETVRLYVWSLAGPRLIRVPAGQAVGVTGPSGETIEVKPKKNLVELPLTDEPSLITGIEADVFLPVEVVEEAIVKFKEVIARGDAKGMNVSGYNATLSRVQELVKNGSLFIALDMVQVSMDELTRRLRGLEGAPEVRQE